MKMWKKNKDRTLEMVTYKVFFAYYLNHLKNKLVILNKNNNHILCGLKHV